MFSFCTQRPEILIASHFLAKLTQKILYIHHPTNNINYEQFKKNIICTLNQYYDDTWNTEDPLENNSYRIISFELGVNALISHSFNITQRFDASIHLAGKYPPSLKIFINPGEVKISYQSKIYILYKCNTKQILNPIIKNIKKNTFEQYTHASTLVDTEQLNQN